jgi:CRISPR-associated endonuclease Csn1
MSKILGLDLGTNSIGWALIDDVQNKILGIGSRIFPMGVENLGEGEGREMSTQYYLSLNLILKSLPFCIALKSIYKYKKKKITTNTEIRKQTKKFFCYICNRLNFQIFNLITIRLYAVGENL